MNNDFNALLSDLTKLCSIDSSFSSPTENYPFGEGVFNALNFVLSLGEKFGFKTINYDNYIGEIVFGEDNFDELAVLCHVDVVPAGDEKKWKSQPFTPLIENGNFYARGASDDKGPLIATLYALKKLKESGFKPNKKIKLIVGCNEESGWKCIEHYKQVAHLPEQGFSPDASFPVIYAEKGILQLAFYFDFDKEKLFEIDCGVAPNVVCDYAKIKALINEDIAIKHQLKISNGYLESFGKTAHASEPDLGINAFKNIVGYLDELGIINKEVKSALFDDCFGLKLLFDETGALTMSPNMAVIEQNKLKITVDIRYPATLKKETILEKLKDFDYKILSHQEPLYNDKNSTLIQTLLNTYNSMTNQNLQPIAIGGGTYARALKLGCGFGPESYKEPSLAHQPNEYISLEKLEFLVELYAEAIKRLSL